MLVNAFIKQTGDIPEPKITRTSIMDLHPTGRITPRKGHIPKLVDFNIQKKGHITKSVDNADIVVLEPTRFKTQPHHEGRTEIEKIMGFKFSDVSKFKPKSDIYNPLEGYTPKKLMLETWQNEEGNPNNLSNLMDEYEASKADFLESAMRQIGQRLIGEAENLEAEALQDGPQGS